MTYKAKTGYHFDAFTDISQNGVTAARTDENTVTVSGSPTANVEITIPNAVANGSTPATDPTPGKDDTPISASVTFKVVGGAWNDGSTADKTVTLTGTSSGELNLKPSQIPAVGNKPNADYKAGSWDTVPSTQTPITTDTTYTYTYAKDPDAKEDQPAPEKPTATDVTHHTITVKVEPDEEASIDGGGTWVRPKDGETTVTFDNLEPGKTYTILVRKIATDTKNPSPPSEPLVVRTPAHGSVKSQVVIGEGLPNLTVDGFDDALAAKLCTPEDHEALENGENILITLRAAKQDNPPAEDKALCDELAAKIGKSAAFGLALSVDKKIGDAEATPVIDLGGNAITVSFDLPNELTQVPVNTQRTFYFIRVHNGAAEQLPHHPGGQSSLLPNG